MFLYYFAPTEELKTDADAPEALALRALHWTTLTAAWRERQGPQRLEYYRLEY